MIEADQHISLQARVALRFPWWTLKSSFQDMQKLAQLEGSAKEVQDKLDMASSISKAGIPPGMHACTMISHSHTRSLIHCCTSGADKELDLPLLLMRAAQYNPLTASPRVAGSNGPRARVAFELTWQGLMSFRLWGC